MSTSHRPQHATTDRVPQARRNVLGPDYANRRQPGHLHQDRFRQTAKWSSAIARRRIFRGYSVFMKGKDPRDAHFITSRICGICGDNHATCASTPSTWRLASSRRAGRMDHQPRRGGRVHVRPLHLPGQPGRVDFCEQMVRETNPAFGTRPSGRDAPHALIMATRRSPTS